MKKLLAMLMCLCVMFSFAACGTPSNMEEVSDEQRYRNFMSQFTTEYQDITAVNARVETDAEGNKMLVADIKNAGFNEISNVVLAFAAWDADGNFITIKSKDKPDNTAAEFQFNVSNVSIQKRSIWSAETGAYLDASCDEIAYVKAMVVSCKNGANDYNNELYTAWKETYLQKPLTDSMRTVDAEFDPHQKLIALRNQLATEKVYITKVEIVKNYSEQELYLVANLKNDTEQSLTGFWIAFLAWDEQGTPICIDTIHETVESDYVQKCNFEGQKVLSGGEWIGCVNESGQFNGLPIDFKHNNIAHAEAFVIAYVTEDGQTHENSLLSSSLINFYKAALLEDWMKTENTEVRTDNEFN